MTSDIRVIHYSDFLRATVQGKLDLERSKQALLQITEGAPTPDTKIMIDVREAPSYLSLPQLSELVEEFKKLRLGDGRKIAGLTSMDRFDNAQFFDVSARGAGHSVQAFTSFEEAFDWIQLGS